MAMLTPLEHIRNAVVLIRQIYADEIRTPLTCGLNSNQIMNIFFEEHQKLLSILLHHQVRFILIGGYAVIYYGYGRTTGDMDIWLENRKHQLRTTLISFQ